MKKKFELGIMGAGNMGAAILKGVLEHKLVHPKKIALADIDSLKLKKWKIGLKSSTPADLVSLSKRILIAVKPQQIAGLFLSIKNSLTPNTLVISIAAGVPVKKIKKLSAGHKRIIRVMPSTPSLVGAGAAAISARKNDVTDSDLRFTKRLFSSIGICEVVPERYLDAVTALSGSGPAYFFLLMEHLMKAGKKMNLPDKFCSDFVLQTAVGAARLAQESTVSPSSLRERVTSKGGTTEAAIKHLKKKRWGDILESAVLEAYKRSTKLGR